MSSFLSRQWLFQHLCQNWNSFKKDNKKCRFLLFFFLILYPKLYSDHKIDEIFGIDSVFLPHSRLSLQYQFFPKKRLRVCLSRRSRSSPRVCVINHHKSLLSLKWLASEEKLECVCLYIRRHHKQREFV